MLRPMMAPSRKEMAELYQNSFFERSLENVYPMISRTSFRFVRPCLTLTLRHGGFGWQCNENVWSAAGLQGDVWSRRQVCANVFGLWVEISSPGHDELRACLSF